MLLYNIRNKYIYLSFLLFQEFGSIAILEWIFGSLKNASLLVLFIVTILMLFRSFYYKQTGVNFLLNRIIYSIYISNGNINYRFFYYYFLKKAESSSASNCYLVKTYGTYFGSFVYSGYILFDNDIVKGTIPSGVIAKFFINKNNYLDHIEIGDKLPDSYYK